MIWSRFQCPKKKDSENHQVVYTSSSLKRNAVFFLLFWIVALLAIGSFIGSMTRGDVQGWYKTLPLSPLTPPNIVFPIAWTFLYGILAFVGYFLSVGFLFPQGLPLVLPKTLGKTWRYLKSRPRKLSIMIGVYGLQLMLNWSWSLLFFTGHFVGWSLLCVVFMDLLSLKLLRDFSKVHSLLFWGFLPYVLWILFATYLNGYIFYQMFF